MAILIKFPKCYWVWIFRIAIAYLVYNFLSCYLSKVKILISIHQRHLLPKYYFTMLQGLMSLFLLCVFSPVTNGWQTAIFLYMMKLCILLNTLILYRYAYLHKFLFQIYELPMFIFRECYVISYTNLFFFIINEIPTNCEQNSWYWQSFYNGMIYVVFSYMRKTVRLPWIDRKLY